MASHIEKTNPVTREVTLQGMDCHVTMDKDGISVTRKGDRHREKRTLALSWDALMDSLEPENDSVYDPESYAPTSYLEYADEQ